MMEKGKLSFQGSQSYNIEGKETRHASMKIKYKKKCGQKDDRTT